MRYLDVKMMSEYQFMSWSGWSRVQACQMMLATRCSPLPARAMVPGALLVEGGGACEVSKFTKTLSKSWRCSDEGTVRGNIG